MAGRTSVFDSHLRFTNVRLHYVNVAPTLDSVFERTSGAISGGSLRSVVVHDHQTETDERNFQSSTRLSRIDSEIIIIIIIIDNVAVVFVQKKISVLS